MRDISNSSVKLKQCLESFSAALNQREGAAFTIILITRLLSRALVEVTNVASSSGCKMDLNVFSSFKNAKKKEILSLQLKTVLVLVVIVRFSSWLSFFQWVVCSTIYPTDVRVRY